MSSNKEKKESMKIEKEEKSQQSTTTSSATAQQQQQQQDNNPPALPLGWTQVKRRRREDTTSSATSNVATTVVDWASWCCDDPSCRRRGEQQQQQHDDESNNTLSIYSGHAIICLHEPNPDWWQGYFITSSNSRPWGILAIQESLDECLECADGGYRQASICIYPYNTTTNKMTFKAVEWTGGDMMRLQKQPNKKNGATSLLMETHKMVTSTKAVPYVERYFSGLVRKFAQENNNESTSTSSSVLELMPDVAIVIGPMTIKIPKKKSDDNDDDGGAEEEGGLQF